MKKIIFTDKAPAPIGPYNQAVLIGNTLYTSGQIALHPQTMESVSIVILLFKYSTATTLQTHHFFLFIQVSATLVRFYSFQKVSSPYLHSSLCDFGEVLLLFERFPLPFYTFAVRFFFSGSFLFFNTSLRWGSFSRRTGEVLSFPSSFFTTCNMHRWGLLSF